MFTPYAALVLLQLAKSYSTPSTYPVFAYTGTDLVAEINPFFMEYRRHHGIMLHPFSPLRSISILVATSATLRVSVMPTWRQEDGFGYIYIYGMCHPHVCCDAKPYCGRRG
ncbi:hypothetical protein SLA2020_457830 [Shorea laevis]